MADDRDFKKQMNELNILFNVHDSAQKQFDTFIEFIQWIGYMYSQDEIAYKVFSKDADPKYDKWLLYSTAEYYLTEQLFEHWLKNIKK
jgi:hypothetical protein